MRSSFLFRVIRLGFILLMVVGFVTFSGPGALAAPAITIHVNATGDSNAANNFISLREAILLVNGGTGGDGLRTGLGRALTANEAAQVTGGTIGASGTAANIVFSSLPGLSTITIINATGSPGESLPPIMTSGVVVDGTDALGGRVTVDGSGAPAGTDLFWLGWTDGLGSVVQVNSITLQDIIITHAKRYSIVLNPARTSLISNCDVSGSTDFAIFIQGKFGAADGNIIQNCTVGNNLSLGVVINRPGATNNIIRNNRIGVNAAGTAAAPNSGAGLALFTGTFNNTITGNVISGNTLQGIYLSGKSGLNESVNDNVIQGNKIGTAADGISPIPNIQGIVFDDNNINNTIGGSGAGQGNIIAFNTQSGIVAVGNNDRRNRFTRNSIFSNTLLGVDLMDDKLPTAGISGGGVGPNELALRPTLTTARAYKNFGWIAGSASPNSTNEIYVSDNSPSGFGSGKTYCATLTANGAGAFSFFGFIACKPGSAKLTGLSALADGSTSEFGNNLAVSALPLTFMPMVRK